MKRYCPILENRTFYLGKRYRVFGRSCVFMRSTQKGFNFFCEEVNSIVFLNKHFYSRKHGGKQLPIDMKKIKCVIPLQYSQNIYEEYR